MSVSVEVSIFDLLTEIIGIIPGDRVVCYLKDFGKGRNGLVMFFFKLRICFYRPFSLGRQPTQVLKQYQFVSFGQFLFLYVSFQTALSCKSDMAVGAPELRKHCVLFLVNIKLLHTFEDLEALVAFIDQLQMHAALYLHVKICGVFQKAFAT